MDLIARKSLVGVVLSLATAGSSAAQFRPELSGELPNAAYYLAVHAFYSGEYGDAERALGRETRGGLRIAQARWVDSICYHAMLGEVLYHQGRNAEALAEFDQACELLLAYPNWLLQVKFQRAPQPDLNRLRRPPPWGQSERRFTLGSFPTTEQVLIGDLDANRAFQQGGVAALPMLWRLNAAEVVRTAALAIRRRNELLGPLALHDRISKDLSETFSRGNLAPPNHWSAAWIDLLRGLAQVGVGKLDEADKLIGRSVVIDGGLDHPLTCVALLEQGRLAMMRGDSRAAAKLFAEAGFSAYYVENEDVITESVWLGWLNHLSSGGAGLYPPLETVAAWAQIDRLQHITTKLRLAQAESLAWMGELDAATVLAADTNRRLREMRTGRSGIHQLYVQANLQLLGGQRARGSELLAQALAAQQAASVRNFRIARTNEMFDAGVISPRVAVDLYAAVLADPAPADWVFEPLDSMAVLQTPHDAAFDRWFLAAMGRKEVPLAIEIAERAKRRRYLAPQPLGGRLAALRTILEAPEAELSRDALLQRQQILASFPTYGALADAGQRVYEQLRAGPIVPLAPADAKPLSALYDAWKKNVDARGQMLAELAPRRLPSSIEFPPLRQLPELQKTLRDGEALIMFHAAAGNLFGFLITQAGTHHWQIRNPQALRKDVGEFLRALGNYGANRPLPIAELKSNGWRDLATATYETVFADARLDLDKTTGLVIVPDVVLWYLPFEALVSAGSKSPAVLADGVTIRYGPTAALAVADSRPLRRRQRTGIVANELEKNDAALNGEEAIQNLEQVVIGPVRLPTPLPEPGYLVAPLLDGLVSLDDIDRRDGPASGWWPLPRARNEANDVMSFGLPYGGPDRIVITGFATEAEQGLKSSRRSGGRRGRPGEEVFQSLCDMMADGARTILLTRWRTGGRTNLDLVREFLRELPQSRATDAWQRACLLARESPLDASQEPRLKRLDETAAEPPRADHPFFWAGYLLIDTSPRTDRNKNAEPPPDEVLNEPPGKKLPPPVDDTPPRAGQSASD